MRTEKSPPRQGRAFFGLAAEQARRELLNLARHFRGAKQVQRSAIRPHRAVAGLPVEEGEVLSLVFYHGWTQEQIAELFEVSARTVRRRW